MPYSFPSQTWRSAAAARSFFPLSPNPRAVTTLRTMSRRSRPTLVVRGEPLKKTRSVGVQFPLDFCLDYGANPSEYKLSGLSTADEDSGDLDSEMGGYPDSLHSTDSEQSELEDELDDEETEETEQSEHIKPSHQQMRGNGPEATNIAAGRVEYFPGYSPTGGKLEATQTVRSPNKKLPVPMAANFIKKNYVDYDNLQIQQGVVIDWACIDFSSMHSRLHRFFYKLAAVCEGIGMHFSCAPVKTFHVKSITPDNIGITFQDVRNSILEILSRIQMKGEPIGLLLVILPHNRAFDAKIEEACENLRVVYQCCLPCDIYKPTKQYLKGTARAIKSKVVERDAFIPFVSEGPTIILGADTSCDTVASVGTSVDWQEFRDYKTVVEPNNGLVIQQLGRMICSLLGSVWKMKRASRIIFFRHGINEDHITDICHQELAAIKQAFTHLKIGLEPSVTFVVVGGKGFPDDTLDFFCTHGYVEGTKVARYRVIHDENSLTLDQLESIIIKLCLLRDRKAYRNISMVPPAYAAWSQAQKCFPATPSSSVW